MPPLVRSWGEEQKVIEDRAGGGLNPLRGPSAALAALGSMVAQQVGCHKQSTSKRGAGVPRPAL